MKAPQKLKKNIYILYKANNRIIFKNTIKENLNAKLLYNELVSLGAFIGNYYKWTHFSQSSFILGYRNNYSFYKIEICMKFLKKATLFLKKARINRRLNFIFVGNPEGAEEQLSIIFNKINLRFFPNENWYPGFFSRKSPYSNYVLVVYNITQNSIAFHEAVNAGIPVVGFVTPSCDIRGVDYPIILNLKNNNMWYGNYCKALFI